jgi:hypothetical protein
MVKTISAWSAQCAVQYIQGLRQKLQAMLAGGEEDVIADLDVIRDTIEGEVDVEAVTAALIKAHEEAKADEVKFKSLEAQYCEARKCAEARKERFRNLIEVALRAAGQESVRTWLGTARIQQGRKTIQIIDASKLPPDPEFWRMEPNKSAVVEAFKAGKLIPGVEEVEGDPFLVVTTPRKPGAQKEAA